MKTSEIVSRLPRTCEKCNSAPVQITEDADGLSIAMLKTGHLVCSSCKSADQAREQLEAKAETFPRGPKRDHARKIVALTLSGKRVHGQDVPSIFTAAEANRIRHAIDAEWDRTRCVGMAVGDRITVRCYCDDTEREGTIESIVFGASAPVAVLVDYPEGFTEVGGYEPINPSGYAFDRLVRPA